MFIRSSETPGERSTGQSDGVSLAIMRLVIHKGLEQCGPTLDALKDQRRETFVI